MKRLFATAFPFHPMTAALLVAAALNAPGQQTSKSPFGGSPMMMMPSVAPLLLEGAGFTSTLYMANDTNNPIQAMVDVYSLDGARVASQSLTVPGNGSRSISMASVLTHASRSIDIGSVRVSTNPNRDGLLSALALSHIGATETYFDEELPMPTDMGSNVLRGVAYGAGSNAVVAISSLAVMIQHVTLACTVEGRPAATRIVSLLPSETLLVAPCMPESFGPILSASDVSPGPVYEHNWMTGQGAAISIKTDGMPGELAAYGVVPHFDRGDLSFTALNFTDPKLKRSSGAVYAGVPVGPSPLLAMDSYQPSIVLANFGSKPPQ